MKISGKVGDIHIAEQGLSSVRITVEGQPQPAIVNLTAAQAAELAVLAGKNVTLTIEETPAA
jgi:hypothetical protein